MGSKSDSFQVNAPASVALDAAAHALQQTGAKVEFLDQDALVVEGSKGFSLASWGEKISVRVEPVGPTVSVIHISSKPVMPLNVLDFGKNARNVKSFRAAVETAIPRTP
jgi:hypothetical protein